MEKKTNQYHLRLTLRKYADGSTAPSKEMELVFDNHDEIFNIIAAVKRKNPFDDPEQAAQFALGLKLFSEVLIKNRNHSLFQELGTVFPAFMKRLKSL